MSKSNPYASKVKHFEEEIPTKPLTPVIDPSDVPSGSIATILKWVKGDSAKAQVAYEVEVAADKSRVSLISQLKDLI